LIGEGDKGGEVEKMMIRIGMGRNGFI